jgi:hypothetical protein
MLSPDDGGGRHVFNVGLLQRDYTAQYIPKDCHLGNRRRENLKSHSNRLLTSPNAHYVRCP